MPSDNLIKFGSAFLAFLKIITDYLLLWTIIFVSKRIKTWLRTTMTEQRLVDLAVISIERDLSTELSLDQVIIEFAGKDSNRRIILP